MEDFTKEELYQRLTPALRIKSDEYRKTYNEDIELEDIWNMLISIKWEGSNQLMLSDMVHDIINIDIDLIHNFISNK